MPRRPIPCRICGEPVNPGSTSRPDPAHNACMSAQHGTVGSYTRRGCRCDECRRAAADAQRKFRTRFKARTGRSYDAGRARPSKFIPKESAFYISPADRLAIYERDGWICQLCFEPVNRDAHYNDNAAPSLDHVECQSWVLIPDHRPENLRLTHRACNCSRGNRG